MLRTRVVWTGVAGSPYYSTFYWAGDGQSIADAAQLATIGWCQDLVPYLYTSLSAQVESEVLELNEANGQLVGLYDVAGSTSDMNNGVEPLPFQVQLLTFFGTAGFRNGRRVRGRNFLPGMVEPINSTGIGPSEITRETFQNIYVDNLGGSTAIQVVWSRPIDGGAPGEATPVTSYQTSNIWSTLRSRRAV